MNILLIGGGGREHAIAWKLAQSKSLSKLYTAPGNAGTAEVGTNVSLDPGNFEEVRTFLLENAIHMVIVGPEAPLVDGLHDRILADEQTRQIPVIGPVKAGAMLEGSKDFANRFMTRYNIPTAAFKTFDKASLKEALKHLEETNPPYVLKADGLAAGKGVLILNDLEEAKKELSEMLEGEKFGSASSKVVIEEFLDGIELSVFVLTDGNGYKILPAAKDYKRIGEGDTGLNTGGMGSISPVPFADARFMEKVEERIIRPTIEGLKKENIPYKGFIFFGLINVKGDPYVIEYNVRMGDPEAESVIPRIQSDLLDLFQGVANGDISTREIELDPRYTAAVFLVSGGYPGSYKKGMPMTGFKDVSESILFHAGTKQSESTGTIETSGGRVIAVCAYGSTMDKALEQAYIDAAKIQFEGKYFRSDLGFDLRAYTNLTGS
jgi:phosphoribosylamine--glycine ligase